MQVYVKELKTIKKKVDILIKMAKMVAIRLFLGRTQLLKSINGFEGIFVPFEGGGVFNMAFQ